LDKTKTIFALIALIFTWVATGLHLYFNNYWNIMESIKEYGAFATNTILIITAILDIYNNYFSIKFKQKSLNILII